MKTFLLLALFSLPHTLMAGYKKPELLARYSGADAFNAPVGLYCFTSEPWPSKEGVFLGCSNSEGHRLMVRFTPAFEIVSVSESGLFSHPKEVAGRVSWYEFDEAGVRRLFEYQSQNLTLTNLKNLGPAFALIDSFIPIKNQAYVYRLQDEAKRLLTWKAHTVNELFAQDISHIFPPVSSVDGDFIMKVRRENLNENAPDELLLYNGHFKTLLKDRDADSVSPIKSFRHQYALDKDTVALVATDELSEAMMLIKQGSLQVVARVGKDVKTFDHFSPKMRNGVLVFRGVDLENRKALWVFENNKLTKLLTQGDVVLSDKGPVRVDYKNQDALLYGAPGISEEGDVYQQAILSDIDSPMTHLGVGLIKFKKE